MPRTDDVVREVLSLLGPMVEADGGSISLDELSDDESRLDVHYARGFNDACSTCVIDGDSLKAFIEEGLQTRGINIARITVRET